MRTEKEEIQIRQGQSTTQRLVLGKDKAAKSTLRY